VEEVQRTLGEIGQQLQTKVKTPVSQGYRPELDASPEISPRQAKYFQGLIGVLRWMIELGWIDVMVSVAMLSRFLAAPREGHLNEVLEYDRSSLVFNHQALPIDEKRFEPCDWSQFYPDATEAIPQNAPEPRGASVVVSCFMDADHAGCRVTQQSHTGIIISVQGAPIMWYSKRQNTVESSMFGSEFIAMKTAIEQFEALRHKLCMMGIPIEQGPANVFCDNEAVFKNSAFPESTVKKKHNSIAYHRTREVQAAGTVRIAWEPGDTNRADILTKLLAGPRL
jgi:hypothetical protein